MWKCLKIVHFANPTLQKATFKKIPSRILQEMMLTHNENIQQLARQWNQLSVHSFEQLADFVRDTHHVAQGIASRAINRSVTLRNWLIGYYIVEFEQKGEDRAKYGDQLLERLAERVNTEGINITTLKYSRLFYQYYPYIADSLQIEKSATASHQLGTKSATVSHPSAKSATALQKFTTPADKLVNSLSFSHIREIMTQSDPLARFFYETESIRGGWSVRELRRQIATNLYFRAGVSGNPEKLLSLIEPEKTTPEMVVRDPLSLEFLGLKMHEVVSESVLEEALISHLQEFLMELGSGFCFEARQKRIVIDGNYYFADLVFYHRYLHCSVIVELKNDAFKHEYMGQLNAYVAYYKANEMRDGDNPPVGILLCTQKGEQMVEYATAGMDENLFVSTYQLQLPDKSTLEHFLSKQTEKC